MEKGEVIKNENGTGNIYKMKDKRRKLWAVRVTTGYTLEGKQVRKYIGTYETKREAQESLFEYLKNPKLYKKITFKEITDLWFESYKKKEELRKVMELFN
jgi:uroporphyrinogen-III decarboxylase